MVVTLMATNFPNSLDNFSNPQSTDSLSGHAQQHTNLNDAIEALEAKVGTDNSNVSTSLDYRVSSLESAGAGSIAEELGLAGNNDVIITGIENKTVIDSFPSSTYATARYVLQFTKNQEITSEALDIINDGDSFHVNEYEVSSNTTNQIATVTLERNSGIINLCVTPVSGTITVRFYRTALKA